MSSGKEMMMDTVSVCLLGEFSEHLEDGRITEDEINNVIQMIQHTVNILKLEITDPVDMQ